MNRFRLALVALGAAVLGSLAITTPAQATVSTWTVNVLHSPDDTVDGAPWARDTFNRVTSVSEIEGGFQVSIWDSGNFKTPAGVTGTLDGQGTWKITGGQRKSVSLPTSFDRADVPAKDSFTGEWWKRFVKDGATPAAVAEFTWKWTYKSVCWKKDLEQTRIEDSANGSLGERPNKVCPPKPGETTPPTTKPTTAPPTTDPTTAPPTGTKPPTKPTKSVSSSPAAVAGPSLPLTGPGIGAIVGVGALVLLTGAGLLVATRRRKVRFGS